jgi:putative acetyltransferase
MIRAATEADRNAIVAVTRDAFAHDEVAVVRIVEETEPEISLVYSDDDGIVGHVLLSHAHIGERPVLLLGPLSVATKRQRQGIGGELTRAAIRIADERLEPIVLLLGHPEYYPRFGFRKASDIGIEPPEERLSGSEAWLALKLHAYDPSLRGRVVFPPAFG